jgi:hypothetical protein
MSSLTIRFLKRLSLRDFLRYLNVPRISEGSQQTEALLAELLGQIPTHTGRTWIVVREDRCFKRVTFLERFMQYLRVRGMAPRLRISRTIQNQLDVINFITPVATPLPIPKSQTPLDQTDARL